MRSSSRVCDGCGPRPAGRAASTVCSCCHVSDPSCRAAVRFCLDARLCTTLALGLYLGTMQWRLYVAPRRQAAQQQQQEDEEETVLIAGATARAATAAVTVTSCRGYTRLSRCTLPKPPPRRRPTVAARTGTSLQRTARVHLVVSQTTCYSSRTTCICGRDARGCAPLTGMRVGR